MINIIISLLILVVAFYFQLKYFKQTQETRKTLNDIFPSDPDKNLRAEQDEQKNAVQIIKGSDEEYSETFKEIISAINNYLEKNEGAADYSTLKDIADRQCDTIDEQIDATAPVPIYFGLCGTLIGIVLGVGVLGFGGGIDSLMGTSKTDYTVESEENLRGISSVIVGERAAVTETGKTYYFNESGSWIEEEDRGSQGITDLLRGVAVAMLTTFFGVILTIIGSSTYKESSRENERKKNLFLNWMQGELLPQMKHDMMSTLNILQKNLNKFNKDFSDNSRQLNDIFANINTTYEGQAEVLRLIEKMDVNNIATANVKVLRELQACTDQISTLKEFLIQSARYLTNVEALNNNLSDYHERTKLIENMGKFFKDEIEQIEIRKAAISKAVADIDSDVQNSFKAFSEHAEKEYGALTDITTKQHGALLEAIDSQQESLNKKLSETRQIVEDLQNLVGIKESMEKIAGKTEEQNSKMDKLLSLEESLKVLVENSNSQNTKLATLAELFRKMPVSQQNFAPAMLVEKETKAIPEKIIYKEPEQHKLPLAAYITGGVTCASVLASCIVYLLKALAIL